MPDVIHQELSRHLRSKTCVASESLSSIPKKIEEFCLLEEGQRVEVKKILDKIRPEDIADARLKAFKKNTGLKILRCSDFVGVDEILLKYHEIHPPFAGKKNKKAEFPDAFALLCLENWANKHDKKILAVSKDDGWKEFEASSSHIHVMKDLGEALKKLQKGVSRAMEDANTFLEQLYDGKRSAEMEGIKDILIDQTSDLTECAEFDCVFQYESYSDHLKFIDFKFCPDTFDKESTHLVRVGRNEIVILMRIEVSVVASVDFLLGVYSSYSYMDVEQDDKIQLEMLLTLNREEDTVKLIETELTFDNDYPEIDFGFIAAPGWDDSRY